MVFFPMIPFVDLSNREKKLFLSKKKNILKIENLRDNKNDAGLLAYE